MPSDPASSNINDSLTPDDIKKLTFDLSTEIDQEIKKQLAEPHPFSDTQAKIDAVVKQAEELKSQSKNTAEAPNPEPRQTQSLSTHTEPQREVKLPEIDPALANLDPLQASLSSALTNLKEGDKIGDGWILKKIYSTSFGHNRSSFYELENSAGAKWTLSPEEMKDLLKTNVQGKGEPANLAPPPNPGSEKESLQINKFEQKNESEPINTSRKIADHIELTKEQIEFVDKLHSDPKLWQGFNSFNAEQLAKLHSLYETGQLLKFGIDAHPLLDKIDSGKLGKEIETKKGDSFYSLVEDEGHSLKYSSEDSPLLGLHILANSKLLGETIHKAEAAGLIVEMLPEPKAIINLVKDANNKENVAYLKLSQFLRLLPANSKFRVLSPSEVSALAKYF